MRGFSARAACLGLLLLMGTGGAPAFASSEPAKEEHGADPADAAPPKRRPTPLESYVMVDPITSTIMNSRRARGLLMVEIGLDVPDAALRAEVEANMRRLQDAYLRSLAAYTVSGLRASDLPDVDAIAARLQRVTDFVMKRPGAKLLLMQVAVRAYS